MAQFTDAVGRVWSLELDLTTADEIMAAHGLDLLDLENADETYKHLNFKAKLVVDVVWDLVAPVAKAKNITPEDFRRAMKPTAIRAAKEAVLEAIADFSPSPEVAEAMRKLFRAAEKKMTSALAAISEDALTDAMSAASAGNSPASSASTPAG